MVNRVTARLTWSENLETREFQFGDCDVVSIGRDESNTIAIARMQVSRRHAVITWENGYFCIRDLDSRNGTYVNALKVPKSGCELKDGDTIHLERFPLQFSWVACPIVPKNNKSESFTTKLVVISGPDQGIEHWVVEDITTIGRLDMEAKTQLMLSDRTISRMHARMEIHPDCVYLMDLGSANGTLINGISVIEPVCLRDGDIIELGKTKIKVCIK
jgi:pSer/pThr/pTyr-binding forkhead associated (FHA) protein